MKVVHVPYHLDECLPDLIGPLPRDADVVGLTVQLRETDVWSRLVQLYDSVAETVEATVRAESVATVVSGDCTVSIGMAAGLQRAGVDPSIVWIDAHGDLQSLETSTSGYLGGMALRLLLGYRSELLGDRLGLRPPSGERVMLVDGRDLDPPEVEFLVSARLNQSTIDDLSAADLPDGHC